MVERLCEGKMWKREGSSTPFFLFIFLEKRIWLALKETFPFLFYSAFPFLNMVGTLKPHHVLPSTLPQIGGILWTYWLQCKNYGEWVVFDMGYQTDILLSWKARHLHQGSDYLTSIWRTKLQNNTCFRVTSKAWTFCIVSGCSILCQCDSHLWGRNNLSSRKTNGFAAAAVCVC